MTRVLVVLLLWPALAWAQIVQQGPEPQPGDYCTVQPNRTIECLPHGLTEICAPGYARAHRMPEAESRAVKRAMLAERGLPESAAREYELDHIVSLALGGSNARSNLQLQPWPEARRKDEAELMLWRKVCREHSMPLAEAQRQMREWRP